MMLSTTKENYTLLKTLKSSHSFIFKTLKKPRINIKVQSLNKLKEVKVKIIQNEQRMPTIHRNFIEVKSKT